MRLKLLTIIFFVCWPFMAHASPVDFSFTALDGKTYTAAEFRGQVVVVNFAAHWCPRCQAEAPDLERAYQFYKQRDVVFLNVFVMSEVPDIKAFVEKYQLTFPVGTSEAMAKQFRIRGVPVTLFIDREGVVRKRYPGEISFKDLQAEIEDLLK